MLGPRCSNQHGPKIATNPTDSSLNPTNWETADITCPRHALGDEPQRLLSEAPPVIHDLNDRLQKKLFYVLTSCQIHDQK